MAPKWLVRVLETEAWRDRISSKSGERFTFDRFEDFVIEKPLAGLGASLDLIKRLVKDDPKAVALIDQVTGGGGQRDAESPTASPASVGDAEHTRRLNLARELGQPFTDHRIEAFRADGERTLAHVDRMVRLNAAYQAAVDAEDLEAIETILVESENWAVA